PAAAPVPESGVSCCQDESRMDFLDPLSSPVERAAPPGPAACPEAAAPDPAACPEAAAPGRWSERVDRPVCPYLAYPVALAALAVLGRWSAHPARPAP